MDWMTPVYLLIAVLLVFLNGFFVLAEFALVKVRATRIEELARQQNRRALVVYGDLELMGLAWRIRQFDVDAVLAI